MFIDLNGVDGFIHISDIAWKRVGNTTTYIKLADSVKAIVTELSKIITKLNSLLATLTKELAGIYRNYSAGGQTVKSTIKNTINFGAFGWGNHP